MTGPERPTKPSQHPRGPSTRPPTGSRGIGGVGERPPINGRDAACQALARQARAFPLLVPTPPATASLEPREAALAHAIQDVVLRRWLTLSHLLEFASGRSLGDLEPAMRAVLLAGTAQLLLLDRIPVHAAIDQSVEWAKRRIRPKAGGMVNAILRRTEALVARDEAGAHVRREHWTDRLDEIAMPDGSALALAGDILPLDADARLIITTSVPSELLGRWRAAGARVRPRALHTLCDPPTILNTRHAAAALPEGLAPHRVPGHHVWTRTVGGSHAELGALLASRADLWVQDPGSSASVLLAHGLLGSSGARSPRVIADVCAGQGTKTRQLAALFPEASILATDADPARLSTLAGVFRGHPRVSVMERDALAREGLGRCDLVLLDVPCSNTGVLPRRPEARYRTTTRTQERMGEVQRQIGADAIPLQGPGGMILYATCSLEREENRAMAEWFARWHGLKALAEAGHEPAGMPGDPASEYSDGSYAVVMGR